MKKAKLDGVIGIRAQDRRMGGTDESTKPVVTLIACLCF